MEAVKKVNEETNILEYIENFTDVNGRNPRIRELKTEFEGQVSEDILNMVISGLYGDDGNIDNVV